jgi:CobQ-like glutamine amidotransferase family enzyme
MELRFLHFYPDLMSLYGSWGNVALLRRHLEDLGNTVTVEEVRPGEQADLKNADFVFMGAGTERNQKAALEDFSHFGKDIRDAADGGVTMLFCGTAMQLLGQSITDVTGKYFMGVRVGSFSSTQGSKRFVGDVYGYTDLYQSPIVGFMNSCTLVSGVLTPLLTELSMGFGNEQERGPEGFRKNNVFASELTGPILVKNPPLMRRVIAGIYNHRGQDLPESLPAYPMEEESYRIACRELKARLEKE